MRAGISLLSLLYPFSIFSLVLNASGSDSDSDSGSGSGRGSSIYSNVYHISIYLSRKAFLGVGG